MRRLITLIATATLAATVLFQPSAGQRMPISIIVSVAAVVLAVQSLFTGRIVMAALFLAVLGVFTPFQNSPFSHALVSILDLATLALFAASPMMFRKSLMTTVSSAPHARL